MLSLPHPISVTQNSLLRTESLESHSAHHRRVRLTFDSFQYLGQSGYLRDPETIISLHSHIHTLRNVRPYSKRDVSGWFMFVGGFFCLVVAFFFWRGRTGGTPLSSASQHLSAVKRNNSYNNFNLITGGILFSGYTACNRSSSDPMALEQQKDKTHL